MIANCVAGGPAEEGNTAVARLLAELPFGTLFLGLMRGAHCGR